MNHKRLNRPRCRWVAGLCLLTLLVWTDGRAQPARYLSLPDDLVAPAGDTLLADRIVYHPVRVDKKGAILPFYSADPGASYDYVIGRVWDFWIHMEADSNGLPYYMNHQVWDPGHDSRGLGGDQLMMALSSWDLLYNYTGDPAVLDNMRFIADYYLAHALSRADAVWPHLPYPYNMEIHSGVYDGDMILGPGYLQPDKAGSFGYELVHLYKKTGERRYLAAAVKMAGTLAENVQPGDNDHSPWPFKVHAQTGKVGILVPQEIWKEGMHEQLDENDPKLPRSAYTTNWTGAMGLFEELIGLEQGDTASYRKAFDTVAAWMKAYPARTNKWGPFFEDIPRWSDTQINAVTYTQFLMDHPELDPEWKTRVDAIFTWVYQELGNHLYEPYGVVVTDEQTAYRQPGNSHSARQASAELRYAELTGDTTYVRNAVRQLHWATYMVDHDGKNFYPTNAVWLTDGYGDYVRHYLRAMAAAPRLAPSNENHLLRSSSIVQQVSYSPDVIEYRTFDSVSNEVLRLTARPSAVHTGGRALMEVNDPASAGWAWQPLDRGGVLRINKESQELRITF